MASIDVLDIKGKKVSTIDINENIFSNDFNNDLVHRVIVAYLSNQRQGNQSAKTRSEVRGGGKKPWRQKGTGRARHGSSRSPIWVGGGITFAPKPRSYRKNTNKKEKREAMKQILGFKLREGSIVVVDKLPFKEIKTKPVAEALNTLVGEEKVLVLLPEANDIILNSAKNIAKTEVKYVNEVNAYELLNNKKIVMTVDTVKKLEEVFA